MVASSTVLLYLSGCGAGACKGLCAQWPAQNVEQRLPGLTRQPNAPGSLAGWQRQFRCYQHTVPCMFGCHQHAVPWMLGLYQHTDPWMAALGSGAGQWAWDSQPWRASSGHGAPDGTACGPAPACGRCPAAREPVCQWQSISVFGRDVGQPFVPAAIPVGGGSGGGGGACTPSWLLATPFTPPTPPTPQTPAPMMAYVQPAWGREEERGLLQQQQGQKQLEH